MHATTRPRHAAALLLVLLALSACAAPVAQTEPSPVPSRTAVAAALPTAAPSATPPALPTPQATATATIPPSPTATASPTPTPTTPATPTSDPAVGLPCPDTAPVKPDYAAYALTADPWPTPDPAAAPPPLSLANPLPNAGRNAGYPYGSDGSGRYLLHNGLDMADEDDALAVAPGDGEIVLARDDLEELFGWRCDWYGQVVVLRLDEGHDGQPVYVLFGHVKDVQVVEGQRVARGEPLAREGTAGVATVAHLHLEVRVGANTFGATRNPLLWLEPWSGSGVIAGRLADPDGRAWQGITVTLIDKEGGLLNTFTYLDDPDHLSRPDPALGENFVFGPVAEGRYTVFVEVQGEEYRRTVEVRDGEVTTLEIVTAPYRTPTPAP
jgi:murein DD-endopeptidase MepM/ murein hydrolase activator NlpD